MNVIINNKFYNILTYLTYLKYFIITNNENIIIVLKNNILNFNEKTSQQRRRREIRTKFAPPFMVELSEKILGKVDNKLYFW